MYHVIPKGSLSICHIRRELRLKLFMPINIFIVVFVIAEEIIMVITT